MKYDKILIIVDLDSNSNYESKKMNILNYNYIL